MSSLPDTDYRNLLVTRDGSAARIVLNRPEKRNALSLELMEEMIGTLRDASARPDTRAIVIEGAGPAFSAGHDLSEMIRQTARVLGRSTSPVQRDDADDHEIPQPVIAKGHGIATAAGCQLVAACDLAIAAEGPRFAAPGVKIGLFCSTPMVPVSRAVSRKRAMQMLLTGDPIDAATALNWGWSIAWYVARNSNPRSLSWSKPSPAQAHRRSLRESTPSTPRSIAPRTRPTSTAS